jgi:hypothetical protein
VSLVWSAHLAALHDLPALPQKTMIRSYTFFQDTTIFELLRGNQHTPKDVARILQISVSTVYKAIERRGNGAAGLKTSTETRRKSDIKMTKKDLVFREKSE